MTNENSTGTKAENACAAGDEDYAEFLQVAEDGRLWWRLEDAYRLGAGYRPVSDDHRNVVAVLHAPSNRVRANERTLLGAFNDDRLAIERPMTVVRDGVHLVDARAFLSWLSEYLARDQSGMPFPNDLARAVRNALAKSAATPFASSTQGFDSLTLALEDWFDTLRSDLPAALRQRVEQEFFPMPWDDLSAEGRRSVALQLDYQHDPATEQERQFWWDFYQRMDALKRQIGEWEAVATPTAGDLTQKEARLLELRQDLDRMEAQQRKAQCAYYPERQHPDNTAASPPKANKMDQYIAYPMVMNRLADRLQATPEELAAWVSVGQKHGGLDAFLNAKELDPPPAFNYFSGLADLNNFDYLSPLVACWFRKNDVDVFAPAHRYLTGKTLIERWSERLGPQAKSFVHAKIAESRLSDLHPISGLTQGISPGSNIRPPVESALFPLDEVEEVEAEDFGVDEDNNVMLSESSPVVSKSAGHLNYDPEMQARANEIAAERKAATKRPITRDKVAKILAKELDMDEATVLRRIRKQWK